MAKSSNIYVSPWYQAISFGTVLVILGLFFSIMFSHFIAHDPIPTVLPLPAQDQQIKFGVHIKNFSDFNVVRNNFDVEAIIWFAFDPSIVSLDTIKKFDIAHGQLKHISDPVIQKVGAKQVAEFNVRFTFSAHLDYRRFPIDDHNISFALYNHYLPINVGFKSDKQAITFDDYLYVPGWNVVDYYAQTGLHRIYLTALDPDYQVAHQVAVVTLSCKRTDSSILLSFLLTLLIIIFTSLFTFSSDQDAVLIVSVTIVALIGYIVIIQNISPDRVSYFILSDYLYLISLLCVIMTMILGVFAGHQKFHAQFKRRSIVAIYTVFIAGCIAAGLLL